MRYNFTPHKTSLQRGACLFPLIHSSSFASRFFSFFVLFSSFFFSKKNSIKLIIFQILLNLYLLVYHQSCLFLEKTREIKEKKNKNRNNNNSNKNILFLWGWFFFISLLNCELTRGALSLSLSRLLLTRILFSKSPRRYFYIFTFFISNLKY